MIAAVVLALSLTAPTALPDEARAPSSTTQQVQKAKQKAQAAPVLAQAHLADDPNSPDREPGFVDHYMPFQLSPAALPQVKDGLIMSHVLGYVFFIIPVCGPLWGPVVAVDGAEFSGDVVISWLLSTIIYGTIAVAASPITAGLSLFAIPYFSTTATLNAIDRDLKKKGYKPADGKKPAGGGNATPPPTGGNTDTPPPSYAY